MPETRQEKFKRLKAAQMGNAQTQIAPGTNAELAAGQQHLQNLQQQQTRDLDARTPQQPQVKSKPAQAIDPKMVEMMRQLQAIASRIPPEDFKKIMGHPTMSPETKLQQLQTIASKRDPNLFGENINEDNMMLNPDMKKVIEILGKHPEMIEKAGELVLASQNKKMPGMSQMTRTTSTSMGLGENKVILTKNQLVETIRKGIVIHERKQFIKRQLIKEVREQVQNKVLIESLLKEGPLSNVFEKIKQGAGTLASKLRNPNAFDPSAAISNADEATKVVNNRLTKLSAEASKLRQKFTQEALKNAELINKYHDIVVALFDAWRSFSDTMAGKKMTTHVMDIIGGLFDDLNSEKEQLEVFLKSLNKATATAATKHGNEQKQARTARTEKERQDLQRVGKGYGLAPHLQDLNAKPVPLTQKKQQVEMPPEVDWSKIKSVGDIPKGFKMGPEHHEQLLRNIVADEIAKAKGKRKSRKRASAK